MLLLTPPSCKGLVCYSHGEVIGLTSRLTQVGRVEDLLHELVDRESLKPGPSGSQASSAYVHAFSMSLTTVWLACHTLEQISNTI